MTTDPSIGAEKLPLKYRFDEVSVRLTRQPGHGFPIKRVSLLGTGSAMLERDGRSLPFRYPTKDLLALLNKLYKLRFFELPKDYTTSYSVFLKDDGTVGTGALRMSDVSSTSVCFAAASYQKCVTYGTEGPRDLEDIVKSVFSEADRLVMQ